MYAVTKKYYLLKKINHTSSYNRDIEVDDALYEYSADSWEDKKIGAYNTLEEAEAVVSDNTGTDIAEDEYHHYISIDEVDEDGEFIENISDSYYRLISKRQYDIELYGENK